MFRQYLEKYRPKGRAAAAEGRRALFVDSCMEGSVEAGEAADAANASVLAQKFAAGGDLEPFCHRVNTSPFSYVCLFNFLQLIYR